MGWAQTGRGARRARERWWPSGNGLCGKGCVPCCGLRANGRKPSIGTVSVRLTTVPCHGQLVSFKRWLGRILLPPAYARVTRDGNAGCAWRTRGPPHSAPPFALDEETPAKDGGGRRLPRVRLLRADVSPHFGGLAQLLMWIWRLPPPIGTVSVAIVSWVASGTLSWSTSSTVEPAGSAGSVKTWRKYRSGSVAAALPGSP